MDSTSPYRPQPTSADPEQTVLSDTSHTSPIVRVFHNALKGQVNETTQAKEICQQNLNLKSLKKVSATIANSNIFEQENVPLNRKSTFDAAVADFQAHLNQAPKLQSSELQLLAQIFAEIATGDDALSEESHNLALKTYDEVFQALIEQKDFESLQSIVAEIETTISIPKNSPFADLPGSLQRRNEQATNKGVYFESGTSAVKDTVIHVTKKTHETNDNQKKTTIEVDGKLAPSKTYLLQKTLKALSDHPPENIEIKKKTLLYTAAKPESGIYSESEGTLELAEVWEVTVTGKGTLIIGADPDYGSLYDRFTVILDENPSKSATKYGNDAFSIFSHLGVSQIVTIPSSDDKKRQDLVAVMWTYFPQALHSLDSTTIQNLSLDDLQKVFDDKTEGKFSEKYKTAILAKKDVDIGYSIPYVSGQKDEVRSQGGAFLVHGIRGGYDGDSWENTAKFLNDKILQTGLIPSEDRFQMGIINGGLSPTEDHMFGGAGSVFTRMIPESALDKDFDVCEMGIQNSVLLLVDLEVFEGRTYQYPEDCYGICNEYSENEEFQEQVTLNWKSRDTAAEFTKKLQEKYISASDETGRTLRNEVMVHKTVRASEIYGLVVSSEDDKAILIEKLKQLRSDINGIPLEQCILSSKTLTSKMKKESMQR